MHIVAISFKYICTSTLKNVNLFNYSTTFSIMTTNFIMRTEIERLIPSQTFSAPTRQADKTFQLKNCHSHESLKLLQTDK